MIYIERSIQLEEVFEKVTGARQYQLEKIQGWLSKFDTLTPDDIELSRPSKHPAFKKRLYDYFWGKCAFCEQLIQSVDHGSLIYYRPAKGAVWDWDREEHLRFGELYYFWLAWDWSNMYLACLECSELKIKRISVTESKATGEHFPIAGSPADPGEYGKRNLYEKERPLLLDPRYENPLLELEFSYNGWVKESLHPERGRETIRILDLNRKPLREARQQEAEIFLNLLNQPPTDTLARQLEDWCADDKPFAGLKRQLLYREFAATGILNSLVSGDNKLASTSRWKSLHQTVIEWCIKPVEPPINEKLPLSVWRSTNMAKSNPNLPPKEPQPEPQQNMEIGQMSLHGNPPIVDIDNSSPIKILFLVANPADTTRLRLDDEMRAIDLALQQAKFRRFEIRQHWAVRVADLQHYLLRHQPDIVHFSGHGSVAGEIILQDNSGTSQPVSPRALSRLFSVLKDNIKCVILNACYTEQQAKAIAQSIDCVVGMSKAIGDEAAIRFATAFYQALGFGRNVKTAFELGCIEIDLESLDEQDTPKLLAMKSNPEDIIFAG